ncbi:MAG: pseudouridine synthase [Nocardioides sp.]|uniref:pseudouridine synthase n=1 Tax=Nocardioides sp. TaxID=35761 RepID=UPI0039E3DB50
MSEAPLTEVPLDDEGLIRLQKFLALSGVASRRACEELMLDGQVTVNGEVVTRLGTKIDPAADQIRVSGKRLPPVSGKVYLAFNKPRGVTSTMSDPHAERTLAEFVADRPERLFNVGRLDTDTTGLLLLTNDGDFAQKVSHPSHLVEKTYVAEVDGQLYPRHVKSLIEGVELDDGPVEVHRARIIEATAAKSIVELTIHDGRKHVVRRLLAELGHPVRQLSRIQVGPVKLGRLRAGQMRELTKDELGPLLDTAAL